MVHNRDKKEGLFRQESLERLSSPERLDQLMKVVNPVDWLTLSTFAGLVVVGLVWSIAGRIPITVEGRGVLIQPRQLVEFQSNISGQLKSLNVQGGQCVQKNQLLATIDPIDLRQQLQLAQGKLTQVQTQAQDSLALSSQRLTIERSANIATRSSFEQRLKDTRALTPVLRAKGLDATQEERRSLEQRLKNARSLVPVMQSRLEERKTLQSQGGISRDSILQVEQEYIQAQEEVANIEVQLKALEVKSTETERQYLENLRSVSDLQAQLQELDAKSKRLDQENLDTVTQRDREIQEVSREITRLEQQIVSNSKIVSTHAGCIIEMNATLGQVVQPGTKLGYLQIAGQNRTITGIGYLAVKDGKRIKPGMKIAITPDTVQRERFGGILGQVTQVSSLPITKEGILSAIGNAELAQTFLGTNGAVIEIEAALESDPNTASGYKWSSSKGTPEKITPGTTARMRITVEERSPITFVLPFLQELSGLK
ncbi:NHLP bacteriocin system secretion protein [Anabaena sp. PCC 7108]|uniref:NHLP bacteriocin system secretion protein n=1 Tax=Anabaena sp. PCC 7108 TaxID=163908 RepID=UPI000348E628|nr:NHLP bacteriocin system secretion protein [Anabaena sp. PCC 7108]